MKIGSCWLLLVGRYIGRYKKDLAQVELFTCGAGQGNMASMDRIEGATKKADIHMCFRNY